ALRSLHQLLPIAVRDRDTISPALRFHAPLRFASDQHFVMTRRGWRRLHDADELRNTRTEFFDRHEAGDVDGEVHLTNSHALAAKTDAADLIGHQAAAQYATQNLDHHGEPAAFVSAERHQHAFVGGLRVGSGVAFAIERPARWNLGLAVHVGLEDLAGGDGSCRHIEQPRTGKRHADRVGAHTALLALPWRNDRRRVAHHDTDLPG